ncbi:alpha-amylase family glycosyl hydrolase [Bifidobacterium phasiani]|uniref:DUF3459 domain-containing protein n=1 Tax=Bifidobacterium phasiani TaxID=2834431 RepID=A0ABS6W8L8_9BIFI|nr:alpha-amylase family glycosyl hydrolase [Bifidobacterium phasiani]MBW3082535.1 DUF3459 domain-containing protein [Bifidobacterium phasiani]
MHGWLNDAVFYEVYPQSFQDSNADGIGDFDGIVQRLDHIRDLGCTAIWINPCFDSSFYDAGYDVRDYFRTAPRYGTNEDLRRLFDEAHARGIRVLLDLVPGHTAIDHPWFRESTRGTRNACTDRYIWAAPGAQDAASPYGSIRGFLCGISERPERAAINCFATQPCLNYGFGTVTEDWQFAADSPEAEATRLLMQDVMAFWLGLGCDGFRVDMAGSLVKEDPGHVWTSRLWRKVRAFLDERFPDAVLVSEWGDPAEALNAGFDMDFLLHFGPSHYLDLFREHPYFAGGPDGDIAAFTAAYRHMAEATAGLGHICIPSGNHDMIRMRETLTEEQMRLAFAFLMTMPGCPFIYYGDEIGMRYGHGLLSKEGAYERTGSRTPMQWDASTNAGFSSAPAAELYLPIDPEADRPTVAAQRDDPDSLYATVRGLVALRHAHPALHADAAVDFLYAEDHAYPFVYRRDAADGSGESLVVAINPSPAQASCPLRTRPGEAVHVIGGAARWQDGTLTVPAGSATVMRA